MTQKIQPAHFGKKNCVLAFARDPAASQKSCLLATPPIRIRLEMSATRLCVTECPKLRGSSSQVASLSFLHAVNLRSPEPLPAPCPSWLGSGGPSRSKTSLDDIQLTAMYGLPGVREVAGNTQTLHISALRQIGHTTQALARLSMCTGLRAKNDLGTSACRASCVAVLLRVAGLTSEDLRNYSCRPWHQEG